MNLANKLTVSRIFLAIIFMVLMSHEGLGAKYLALFIFSIASLTDYFDGRIARAQKMESDFGRIMDPIADKILVLAAFVAFAVMKIIPGWMIIVVIFRELLITGLRLNAVTRGKVLSATMAGKHKTVAQIVAIISILVFLIIRESAQEAWTPVKEMWFEKGAFFLMLVAVTLTLISGSSYLIKNKNSLFNINEKTN